MARVPSIASGVDDGLERPHEPRLPPRLAEVFARSERRVSPGGPMRVTDQGIFMATPLEVVSQALTVLGRAGVGRRVLDAGMGDGRVVAVAATAAGVESAGIESDPALFEAAVENLSELGLTTARAACGSYLEEATYSALGLDPGAFDLVVNYPDGNEVALGAFFAARARPGTAVAFVTPEIGLTCPALELERCIPIALGFRVHLHRVGVAGAR